MSLENIIQTTLNSVSDNVETFVYKDPKILPTEAGAVLVYNQCAFLIRCYVHTFLKEKYNLDHLSVRAYQDDDTSKMISDYHFEFALSDSSLQFVKNTVKNRPISGRPFIFFVTNMQNASRAQQQAIKRLLDTSLTHCMFIMGTTSWSRIDPGVKSRCILLNLCKMKRQIVDKQETAMDASIINFLIKSQKFKPMECIMQCREFAYKLFHMNCSMAHLCKVILAFFENSEKLIHDVIKLCAECEAACHIIHKDIFVYERLMLEIMPYAAARKIPTVKQKKEVITEVTSKSVEDLAAEVKKKVTIRKRAPKS
jgi:hypothetical protein